MTRRQIMENILDFIWNRRSCRKYTSEKVTDEQFKLLLTAGMSAPFIVGDRPI